MQHGPERTPACIGHGLRSPALSECFRVHVAYEDCAVLLNEPARKFVQEIFPAIGELRVQRAHTRLLARSRRACESGLQVAVEMLRLDNTAAGQRCKVLQSEVDSDALLPF